MASATQDQLDMLRAAEITVVVVENTPQPVLQNVFKNAFKYKLKSSRVLDSFWIDKSTPPSAADWLAKFHCNFNIGVFSQPGHHKWSNFSEFFFDACVRFCVISERKNLKLWLSTDIPQAYERVPEGRYNQVHSGIKLSKFSLGTMKDRCTFIEHYGHIPPSASSTVQFEHDTEQLTISFNANKNDKYELFLKYRDLDDFLLIDESFESCCVYLMLNTPPSVYKISLLRNRTTERHRVLRTKRLSADTIGNSSVLALKIADNYHQTFLDVISRLQTLGKKMYWTCISISEGWSPPRPNFDQISENFEVKYSFECLLSLGFIVTDRATSLFETLKHLASDQYKAADRSLQQLVGQLEKDRFIDLAEQFQKNLLEFTKLHEIDEDDDLQNGQYRRIRRAVVTPTRCLLLPSELAFENRILREFGEEYCLRVVFRDENFSKLSCYETSQAEDISHRVRKLLNKGIRVGTRHYQFLACSNSQLRDHGCWFYARDTRDRNAKTASHIRKWMGNFSECTSVSTYMVRMGQCFSNSEETVTVSFEDVEKEKDITTLNEKYCFSDGIGKVSRSLAVKMTEALGKTKKIPSAFQIRFQGCKGVVALDPTLEGERLVIRDSMEKFRSNHSSIEVMKTTHLRRLYLNRQAITLLSGLGVEDKVFQRLQEDVLLGLARMLFDDEKAARVLTSHKFQHTHINFNKVQNAGIGLTTDPFFRGLLLEVYRNSLSDLQRKARIQIPPLFGRNMIGVLDETGKLGKRQVFVQYSKDLHKPQMETIIHSGKVVVTKFPALHPGDMRKFIAIDIPELHHMVDCVVFPKKGERPLPDQMAGSDLDGDEYFVTWLPELIPKTGNITPMNFEKAQAKVHEGPIKVTDMTQYVTDYIKNDKLGLIANAHLAHADREERGIFSKHCMDIAKIHAKAVDFAKTGDSPDLDESYRPFRYPDFMEKTDKCSYKSTKVLGNLFRQCRQIDRMVVENKCFGYDGVNPDKSLLHPKWGLFKVTACDMLACYNKELEIILSQYGIENESEAMTGCIRKWNKRLTQRNEIYDARHLVGVMIVKLYKRTRQHFFEEFGGEHIMDKYTDDLMAKASALYHVTYTQKNPKYLSCPWVVADILCEIRRRRSLFEDIVAENAMQRLSTETETYKEYWYRDGTTYSPTERLPVILRYFRKYTWIQPVVGVIVAWRRKGGFAPVVTRLKLLLLFLDFAVRDNYIKPIENTICLESQDFNTPHDCDISVSISSGSLLMKFFEFLASYNFVEDDFNSTPSALKVFLPKRNKCRLREEAEKAYHQVALSGTLNSLVNKNPRHETEIIEMSMRLSKEVLVVSKGLMRSLNETCPEVKAPFRRVHETSDQSGAYISIRGPKSEVYRAQDLIAEWTASIPAEFDVPDSTSEDESGSETESGSGDDVDDIRDCIRSCMEYISQYVEREAFDQRMWNS